MGKRARRKKPTRREKIAAGGRVVAVGVKRSGQAEIIRPDFNSISQMSRAIVIDIARRTGRAPEEIHEGRKP